MGANEQEGNTYELLGKALACQKQTRKKLQALEKKKTDIAGRLMDLARAVQGDVQGVVNPDTEQGGFLIYPHRTVDATPFSCPTDKEIADFFIERDLLTNKLKRAEDILREYQEQDE